MPFSTAQHAYLRNISPRKEQTSMATIASPSLQSQGVSTLDVLWAFYQSQTSKAKKAFLKRVANEENTVKEAEAMKSYEQTLTDKQRVTPKTFSVNYKLKNV